MNKMKSAAKVIQFNRDCDFYLDMADQLIEKGQYISALTPIRRACKIDSGAESQKRLAELYFLMEQYESSALIYYKLLAQDHNLAECYFGLGQNYYYLNNLDACLHNLNMYMTQSPDSDEVFDAEDLINEFEIENYVDGYKLVYPPEISDYSEIINHGRDLVSAGAYKEASKVYAKVAEQSEYYLLAQNSMTLCSILERDYINAYELAKKAISIEKDNIFSLCNMVTVCYHLNKTSECDKYLIKLLNIETDNLTELYKVANTLCEIKRHENVYNYFNKILSYKPYDTNILHLSAIAAYNCQHFEEAVAKFKTIAKIDENDALSEYFIKFIASVIKEKDIEKGYFQTLDYSLQLPYGVIVERIKKIKSLKTMNKERIKKLYEVDSNFQTLIKWVYRLNKPDLIIDVIKRLIDCNINLDDKILDILLDISPNIDLKKEIIAMKIYSGDKQEIVYSFEGVLKFLKPQYPKNYKEYSKELKTAYSTAYSALAFISDCFENAFAKVIKDVYSAFKDENKINIKALAAVVAYKVSPQIFPQKKYLCRLFGANLTVYNKYLKMLD